VPRRGRLSVPSSRCCSLDREQNVTFTRVERPALLTWAEVFERQPAHWGLRGDPYTGASGSYRCSPTASVTVEASELSPLSRREAFKRRTL
jgi:hypothetical protein